ncbi:MAG: AAA family ATPase, partial [Bacillales bacterium]|nr:AAA family ATPase [Bacillales bacterium]
MIERKKYLDLLIKSKENGFPKVITGIRRCGKSYLLNVLYKDYLLKNGINENNIIEMDLTKISNAYYRDPI